MARYLAGLDATLFDLALALDSVQRSAKYMERAEAAKQTDQDGNLLVPWPAQGGMLAPKTLTTLSDQMMGQVWRFHQMVREVVLGDGLREAGPAGPPRPKASAKKTERR